MVAEAASAQPASEGPKKTITVRYGTAQREVPVGSTIGDLRKKFGPMFNIPEGAKAFSGSQEFSDDTVLQGTDGGSQVLEFIRKSGEKG